MISSLMLKPQVLPKKIHVKKLGYVCQDGSINFQNVKSAHQYAKSVVVKALNQENPFERLVMLQGRRVIKQIDGNGKEVRTKLDQATIFCDTIVHGHPDLLGKGIASSFSDNDVRTLFLNPYDMFRTIKVYNSVGEVSIMKKLGASITRTMGFSDESLNVIRSKNEKALKVIDETSNEFFNIGTRIFEKLSADNTLFDKFVKGLSSENTKEDFATKIGIYAVHIAMKKAAKKLNVSYKTTFSNLNKKNWKDFKDCVS